LLQKTKPAVSSPQLSKRLGTTLLMELKHQLPSPHFKRERQSCADEVRIMKSLMLSDSRQKIHGSRRCVKTVRTHPYTSYRTPLALE
jgi:hypothetical protein